MDKLMPETNAAVENDEINITFPDGNSRAYPSGSTGLDVAESIAKSLAKASVAVKIDGNLWDLNRPITKDVKIEIVRNQDDEALELIRHDCAHVMAEAVQELFPGTQVTIGPNIENGFFYDFARDEPFHEADLKKIETRMKKIVDRNAPITREVWDRGRD